MKKEFFFQINSEYYKKYKLMQFVIFCLSISTITSSIVSYQASSRERIILVPALIEKKMEIGENRVNPDGLIMFTHCVFSLLLNHTSDINTVKKNFENLLRMVHTSYYAAAEDEFREKIQEIGRLKLSSTFIIETVKIESSKDSLLKIKGFHEVTSYGKKMDIPPIEEWLLKFKVTDFNFKILKIEKIMKDD